MMDDEEAKRLKMQRDDRKSKSRLDRIVFKWMAGIVTVTFLAIYFSPKNPAEAEKNTAAQQSKQTTDAEYAAVYLLCASGQRITPMQRCYVAEKGTVDIVFALGVDDINAMCYGISDIAKNNAATRVLRDENWWMKVSDREGKQANCAF